MKTVTLNHGAGGRQMSQLINESIKDKLKNGILERFDDSAILPPINGQRVAMTTDSYVVSPLFFPGGDIGRLCISGTVNDLSTSGATPLYLSLGFILEEGFIIDYLETIIDSIALTAKEANIKIVTGDTKVVQKNKGDGIYINTCGIGTIEDEIDISTYNAQLNDSIFITGTIGDHEVALMKAVRKMFDFKLDIKSDVRPLNNEISEILQQTNRVNVIKDPTRGGVAQALTEIAEHSNCSIEINEESIPIRKEVASCCSLMGLDPLYMANEGKFIILAPESDEYLLREYFGTGLTNIGKVISKDKSKVTLRTKMGGIRRVAMMEGVQLPRIC